ncbi:MAG: hypothetical protein ACYDBB_22945 [Armatimonadota bacterium]
MIRSIVLYVMLCLAGLVWAAPQPLTYTAAELQGRMGNTGVLVDDAQATGGKAVELQRAMRMEDYGRLSVLQPGWYRLTVRVRSEAAPKATDSLSFAMWNPINTPISFRYETQFLSQEFPTPGQYGEVTRTMQVGEKGVQYGMLLGGGWKGLRLDTLTFTPLAVELRVQQVVPNKLCYGTKETGTINVLVQNGATTPQPAHLLVEVESGLDARATIYDAAVTVPLPEAIGKPSVLAVPLPPQPEYGHAVIATLKQGDNVIGTAREYFYTSDRPVQIGHFGSMGIGSHYNTDGAESFVNQMRRHYFPLYEIDFWAPDDATMLVPPPGKDRWWSGQTLAASTIDSMKERIRLGHAQGMKVLGYTDLRLNYGFRIAEYFRKHPELCDWDANDFLLAYGVNTLQRQAREDDNERFEDTKLFRKPRFGAEGIWSLVTGNPAMIDHHVDQLIEGMKFFGFDGWRYDDQYDYDYRTVDLLGRQMPFPGWTNPTIVAKMRSALVNANPDVIFGHNMEWAQGRGHDGSPMPITAKAYDGDYYTEFIRDGGLHLQERWSAYIVGGHAPWSEVADNVFRTGYNAYRWGGHAYLISGVSNARPTDSLYLTALMMAGMSHIAYDVRDDDIGYMRLACRFADLLYGDGIIQLTEPEKTLSVDSGGKALWWQQYVRFREVTPGHRIYLAHLINPPRNAKIGEGDPNPPDAIPQVTLRWTLPAGWKVKKAYRIAGEGGTGLESAAVAGGWYTTTDIVGRDLVQQALPVQQRNGAVEITVPNLRIWSLVALDCEGPAADVAPPAQQPLPPIPALPQPKAPVLAAADYTPFGFTPIVYQGATLWQRMSQQIRQNLPMEKALVAADGATGGKALRVPGPLTMEAYSSGEAITGGTYRISLRVATTIAPPKDAKLNFAAWCPNNRPHPWRVTNTFPLDALTPEGGWQTLTFDAQLGFGWENFGMQVTGGYDGLLFDQLKLEAVSLLSEKDQLPLHGANLWPENQTLTHEGLKVWYGEGLYYEPYRVVEALKWIPNIKIDESPHTVWRDRRFFGAPQWSKPAELAAYDLIVLANIDLKSLTLAQRQWLPEYVKAGGSLLLLGGPYGFGRGFWHTSDLIEPIIPVRMHGYDLRPDGLTTPVPLTPVKGGLFQGMWKEKPTTLWLHQTELKPGATAHLLAGKYPALATWTVGEGRVAVFTVTPLGDDTNVKSLWWRWPQWNDVMMKTVNWLLMQ